MKLLPIVLVALGRGVLAVPWDAGSKGIDMDRHISFSWCRELGVDETCDTRQLEHGRCYNFNDLDDFLNDNLETISVENGRCVIWEKDDCSADHTGQLVGSNLYADNFCPNYKWSEKASSIKCCGGDPDAHWCANPGKKVKCTD